MPIKAYVGLPRHGKSYEVVTEAILPALRQGRRVVSNIAGLNQDAFNSILFAEGFSSDKIGQIVHIEHDEVLKPNFFRTDEDEKNGVETFVQPGDLIALDEIWRYWKKRGAVPDRHMNFFRMHGHFTHAVTGYTCEVCLITQSVKDINENIKEVVAETFQMVKNTKLGSDKSYIVHIFQRGSTAKGDYIRTLPPRFYNAKFFGLYKSHSQRKEGDAVAQEKNPDSRGNILHGGFFKILIPLMLVLILPSGYFVYRFFKPVSVEAFPAVAVPAVAAGAVAGVSAHSSRPVVDSTWRVVGHYFKNEVIVFIVADGEGQMRQLYNPPKFQILGMGSSVELPEGGFATSWASVGHSKRGLLP